MRRFLFHLAFVVILFTATACNLGAPAEAPAASASPQPPVQVTLTNSPTAVPSPTRTPNPFPNPVLRITGEEEVIFDWTTDRCEANNVIDLPARAYRDADGQTQLILSHFVSYRMLGPDLDHLQVDCNRIMVSQRDADPSVYADAEWIAAPYTEDGQTIYAVLHNEYHGYDHPGQCSRSSYYSPCWYNALTLAVSTDGGSTFTHAFNPPEHLIANLPFVYEADAGPAGPRNPSNIIKGNDGYYYMFANLSYYADDRQWVCLMRTQDLSDPTSWRFWDGQGFDGQFTNPYKNPVDDTRRHVCSALANDEIGASLNESITYSTYLNRYVLVGISADTIGGREIWGFYYSFSDDLVHWTRRKLLVEMTLPWTADNNTDVMFLYPALLDPASESRNYETVGQTAYLYFTRHNFGQGSLDRDLIRVPVEFFPSP